MVKRIFLLCISAVFFLYGCAVQTQAQKDAELIQKRITEAKQNSTLCWESVAQTGPGVLVGKEIMIFDDSSPNKFDLLSSKAKLRDNQKKALKEYLQDSSKCRQVILQGLSGLPFVPVFSKYFNSMDLIYANLLSGEMNIGDANKAKKEAMQALNDGINLADAEIKKTLDASHNNEMSGRRAAAAAYLNYSLQQQQLQQQQQMINSINRPINTNCTRLGNTTNCTSY